MEVGDGDCLVLTWFPMPLLCLVLPSALASSLAGAETRMGAGDKNGSVLTQFPVPLLCLLSPSVLSSSLTSA